MENPVSKSQKKREAHALQDAGVALLELPRDVFERLPLPDDLREALEVARAMKSHGAVRRQSQRIGKIMRNLDCEPIFEALARQKAEDNAQTASFHTVEIWRTRLLEEGRDALTAFVDVYPEVDVQNLRSLIVKVQQAKTPPLAHGASRALFRFLRNIIV